MRENHLQPGQNLLGDKSGLDQLAFRSAQAANRDSNNSFAASDVKCTRWKPVCVGVEVGDFLGWKTFLPVNCFALTRVVVICSLISILVEHPLPEINRRTSVSGGVLVDQ